MRWRYKLISFKNGLYLYEYWREKAEHAGIIRYNQNNDKCELIELCSGDDDISGDSALEHFYTVIRNGLPDEYSVSCG